jgi:hypothetical protein
MWQRGPGEGYMAAKDDALAINPKLKCRSGKPWGIAAFWIEDETGKRIGEPGRLARDAWGNAFLALGGKYVGKKTIFPGQSASEGKGT